MKKLILLSSIISVSCSIAAQNTITVKGVVIDKDGNPLPSASISATNGAETTLTESDGSFVIEVPIYLKSLTASYSGMSNKKLKINASDTMIFEMNPKPPKHVYLNVVGGPQIYDGIDMGFAGLEGGLLADWGFYVRALAPINHFKLEGMNVVAGAIKGFQDKYFVKLGIGYGAIADNWNYFGTYTRYDWYEGFAVDFGANFKLTKHFDMGVNFSIITDGDTNSLLPSIELGYIF